MHLLKILMKKSKQVNILALQPAFPDSHTQGIKFMLQ